MRGPNLVPLKSNIGIEFDGNVLHGQASICCHTSHLTQRTEREKETLSTVGLNWSETVKKNARKIGTYFWYL